MLYLHDLPHIITIGRDLCRCDRDSPIIPLALLNKLELIKKEERTVSKEILIQVSQDERRVAVLVNGKALDDFYIRT